MIDATDTELAALLYAGNCGGEYLDSIRLTDLARLNQAQYQTFIRVLISSYQNQLVLIQAAQKDSPAPF
jgi:hypothetical protein